MKNNLLGLCTSCTARLTCGVPVIGLFVGSPVDELAQGGDGVGAHQGVAAEGPAVDHADVEGRMQQLVLRQVLRRIGGETK